jgi:hypothetical protein
MSPAEEAKQFALAHGYMIRSVDRRYDVLRATMPTEVIANVGGYPAALNAMKRDVEARTEETAIMNNPADVRMQCPKTGELATRADDPFEEAAAKTGVPAETLRSVHASGSSLHLQRYGRGLRIPVSVGFDPAKPGADVSVVTLNDVINANIDTVEKSIGVKPGTLRDSLMDDLSRGVSPWRFAAAKPIDTRMRCIPKPIAKTGWCVMFNGAPSRTLRETTH